MKKTKGGKVMNPTDAYRKELRKKELKRNKKERKKVREVGIMKKDPESIREQIEKLEKMKADGALDKARKHKKRQLEDTLNLVLKKRKEYEEKMREKGEVPVMFSHLGPVKKAAEEDERSKLLRPEDSIYYHPLLNPTGAPPPGKPMMYHSMIASAAGFESSSNLESEAGPSAPPPPPPFLGSGEIAPDLSLDSSGPLPPLPLKLPESKMVLPIPPLAPGLPPKDQIGAAGHPTVPPPPPPPVQRPLPPPPPGMNFKEPSNTQTAASECQTSEDFVAEKKVLPPPPGLPPKLTEGNSDFAKFDAHADSSSGAADPAKAMKVLPPPPPPLLPGLPLGPSLQASHLYSLPPGTPIVHTVQQNILSTGIVRFPLPPPPPRMMIPGVNGIPPPPPGLPPSEILQPPSFNMPLGPPTMIRPPLVMPGVATSQEDDFAGFLPHAPQKPSYVKSAAPTVVKRPLAQHTPELTAMVPASVRVKRESAVPKAKPKIQASPMVPAPKQGCTTAVGKSDAAAPSSAAAVPKAQSIDESYMAFLEDMKALGALGS